MSTRAVRATVYDNLTGRGRCVVWEGTVDPDARSPRQDALDEAYAQLRREGDARVRWYAESFSVHLGEEVTA